MSEAHKLCVDVDYRDEIAQVAALSFLDWSDAKPLEAHRLQMPTPSDYVPGEFYKRELPCILAILKQFPHPIDTIVVDSYVWLGDRKGMGAHLFDALEQEVTIIGVAKNAFRTGGYAEEIYRGTSKHPLYITAAGIPAIQAAQCIQEMHGAHRIPALLKQVDRLCRA